MSTKDSYESAYAKGRESADKDSRRGELDKIILGPDWDKGQKGMSDAEKQAFRRGYEDEKNS